MYRKRVGLPRGGKGRKSGVKTKRFDLRKEGKKADTKKKKWETN